MWHAWFGHLNCDLMAAKLPFPILSLVVSWTMSQRVVLFTTVFGLHADKISDYLYRCSNGGYLDVHSAIRRLSRILINTLGYSALFCTR